MKVMMLGVDGTRKGGMWTVVENYLSDREFRERTGLRYIPTAAAGSVPRRIFVFAAACLTIRKELRREKYDIVHMHLSERGSLYRKEIAQKMAKKSGCKTILHMHGADFETWYRACPERTKARIRRVLNYADKILILGRYWEGFIGGLIEDKSKISVLYNAVSVPDENRYDPEAPHILFLGAMIKRKGILELLEAVARIRDRLPGGCRLILCGDDPDGIAAPEIERLGLGGITDARGWVDARQKQEAMAVSAVNVLPSYNEGLPMTILEAMANGIPNITTDVAAIPEAVTNRENGVLIRPGDSAALAAALETLLCDRGLRAGYSAAAWERARRDFSLQSHFNRLISVYRELVEKR